jgi:hypothetical protein
MRRRDMQIGLVKALGGGFDATQTGLVVPTDAPASAVAAPAAASASAAPVSTSAASVSSAPAATAAAN